MGVGSREIDIPERRFEEQIEGVLAEGGAVPLDVALAGGGGGLVLSFDDGFRDFYDVVLPRLVDAGLPALLYLATGFVDAGDPRSGVPASEALSWGMLAEAVSTGLVTVGAHTHGHTDLSRASAREADDEMRRSKESVEEHLSQACRHFAFPWGKASPEAERAARGHFATAALEAWRTNRATRTESVPPRSDARAPERYRSVLPSEDPWAVGRRAFRVSGPPTGTLVGAMTTIDAARAAPPVAEPPEGRPLRVAHVTTVDLTLRFLVLEQMKRLRDNGCQVAGDLRARGLDRGARGRGDRVHPLASRDPGLEPHGGYSARSSSSSGSSAAAGSTWSTRTTRSPV